jgi:hypothetical protein
MFTIVNSRNTYKRIVQHNNHQGLGSIGLIHSIFIEALISMLKGDSKPPNTEIPHIIYVLRSRLELRLPTLSVKMRELFWFSLEFGMRPTQTLSRNFSSQWFSPAKRRNEGFHTCRPPKPLAIRMIPVLSGLEPWTPLKDSSQNKNIKNI